MIICSYIMMYGGARVVPFEELSDLYKMLADPTRLRLLWRLRKGGMRVGECCCGLGVTPSAVSHQLNKLKAARLVREERRGRERIYHLCDHHVELLLDMGVAHLLEEKNVSA